MDYIKYLSTLEILLCVPLYTIFVNAFPVQGPSHHKSEFGFQIVMHITMQEGIFLKGLIKIQHLGCHNPMGQALSQDCTILTS